MCAFFVGEMMALPFGKEEHHANVIHETAEFERFLERCRGRRLLKVSAGGVHTRSHESPWHPLV